MTRQVKTYNPNHVFVDTNVLIGAYSGDARYQTDSDCMRYYDRQFFASKAA